MPRTRTLWSWKAWWPWTWPFNEIGLALEWNPRDMWIGAYWQRLGERTDVWLCALPMLPVHWTHYDERHAARGRQLAATAESTVESD